MPKMKYKNNMDMGWIGLKIRLTCIFLTSLDTNLSLSCLWPFWWFAKGEKINGKGVKRCLMTFGGMWVEKDVEKDNIYMGQL
jgi:hypothetical protein